MKHAPVRLYSPLIAVALCLWAQSASAQSRYAPMFAAPASQDTLRNLALWEDQRVTGEGKLFAYLTSKSPLVRRRAVQVIGRIQDPDDTVHLIPLLNDPSPIVALQTCFALGQLGSHDALPALIQFCEESDPMLRPRAVEALGKIGGPGTVVVLSELLHDFSSAVRAQAALGLARAADPTSVNVLLLAIHDPDPDVASSALYGLGKIESDRIMQKVLPFLKNDEPLVRAYAANTLGEQKNKDALPALISALGDKDIAVTINAARALGKIGHKDAVHPLGTVVGRHPAHLARRAAVEALGTIGDKKGKDYVIQALIEKSVGVRVAAIGALALILKENVELFAEQTMDDGSRLVRAAAIEAMGTGRVKNRVDMLMTIARSDEDALMRAAAIRSLGQIDDDKIGAFLSTRLEDDDWVVTTEVVLAIGERNYREATAALIATYETRNRREDVNIRIAVLDALNGFKAQEAEGLAQGALNDPDLRVRTRAAELLLTLGKTARVPSEREIFEANFDPERIRVLMPPTGHKHAVITTDHGDIEIELFGDDATQTVAGFMNLSAKGFYNGLTFHRVVPNFVVQGGDPRGDGWGDAGYFIRSEFNHYRYGTGMIGIAHDGKDTGGCQFFITHSPHHRLDGRYTIFGRVTKGMNVVYRIDQGDTFSVRLTD